MDYIGIKCPVCGESFTRDDDIVVCPECGAPYHRACYKKNGECVFKDRHGTTEAWKPEREKRTAKAGQRQKCARCGRQNPPGLRFCEICGQELPHTSTLSDDMRRCPRCGSENDAGALFCDHCGLPFNEVTDTNYVPFNGDTPNGGPASHVPPPPSYGAPGQPGPYNNGPAPYSSGPIPGAFPQMPMMFDPMGGVNPTDTIGGLPAGEIAKLVQTNSSYYMPVFMNIDKFKKSRFNFCAFLFSGGWLLYRKQYKWGAIVTGLIVLLYGCSLWGEFASQPIFITLYSQVGVAENALPTMQQYWQMASMMSHLSPGDYFLCLLPGLCSILIFVISLLSGFLGNRFYLKHCVTKITAIHQYAEPRTDCAPQLQEQGGVNTSLAVCMLICYMIVVYLPRLFF